MLERVTENFGLEYTDVMVLYGNENDLAAAWCKERGWQYYKAENIKGCEARCVVHLNCVLDTERITRGINMLIIVRETTDQLQLAVDHSDKQYQCEKMPDCPYTGTTLIQKIPWENS